MPPMRGGWGGWMAGHEPWIAEHAEKRAQNAAQDRRNGEENIRSCVVADGGNVLDVLFDDFRAATTGCGARRTSVGYKKRKDAGQSGDCDRGWEDCQRKRGKRG